MNKSLLIITFLVLSLLWVDDASAKHIKIGVLAFQSKTEALARWNPLAQYLQQEISQHSFEILPLNYIDLDKAIKQHKIDFILTSPGHYVRLEKQFLISSALMTLINKYNDKLMASFGGVIFSLANKEELPTLKDIENKIIAATSPDSLGGFQMQAYELHNIGISLSENKIQWTGMPHDNVVFSVLNSKSDIGFVRTGVLESMVNKGILSLAQIHILNKQNLLDYPFVLSTHLYSEWPFAAAKGSDHQITRLVVSKLLSLPHGSKITDQISIQGFAIPANYEPVRNILKILRVEPYDKLPENYWLYLQDDFGWYALMVIITIVIIIILTIRLSIINTKLEATNHKLAALNHQDGLTHIGNRRYFDDAYLKEWNRAIRTLSSITVMMIDIDFFKNFNDSYGHQQGDYVLKTVAQTLKKTLHRSTDEVYRYGGEEFIVISIGTTEVASKHLAEQLRKAIISLEIEHNKSNINKYLTVSIGVSTIIPKKNEQRQTLIKTADDALYLAKQKRNTVVFVA